jgi:hypothetical protein
MADQQSPVQAPLLEQRISQLEQRIQQLEQRLSGVLSVKTIQCQRFEIFDNVERTRAIIALSDDQESVGIKLFNNAGVAVASIEERFDEGGELVLTGGSNGSGSVKFAATKDDAQGFFLPPANGQWMLFQGRLQLFKNAVGRVAEFSTDAAGETDLKFFNGNTVVADIGTNGLGGGSVNVNASAGFINMRADQTGTQMQIHNFQKGAISVSAIDDPTISLRDKNGKEHVLIEADEGFAHIQLLSGDPGTGTMVDLGASDKRGSVDVLVGNQGSGANLEADSNGGEVRVLHRQLDEVGRRKIVLDAQGTTPTVRVEEGRDACSVRPSEILFLNKGKIVSQVPENVIDEDDGDGTPTSTTNNTLSIPLGSGKTVNDGPRICPTTNPFKNHGFDTRDHFIEVFCEVTHPTIEQVKNDVIDCARKAAIAAAIVAVVVAVATEGSGASASFSAAVTSFKVSFRQCLISKGVDIADQLDPKITTKNRFGEWSGH